MRREINHDLERSYQTTYGRLAGYLPADRSAVDRWQKSLRPGIEARVAEDARHTPAVAALQKLIHENGIVRMYVDEMMEQVPRRHRHVRTVDELLHALDLISTTAPLYNANPKKRIAFPMSTLFTYMMMTTAGEAAFRDERLNAAIAEILREWCTFLDSSASQYVLTTEPDGWLSPAAVKEFKLNDFIIPDRSAPHWGFASYNAWFHRQIKPECRPVASPDDPRVIVSANDGTVYKIERKVKAQDRFWLKAQPYSLVNMLNNSEYVDRFVGGDVFQSFLSGADYHRWRAPIAGTVRRAEVVNGLMFSDAESAGKDTTAGTYSQGYEASVNTRALVYIESDDPVIGMVCVIPIGITEISSVTVIVHEGERVEKGQELGWFSYGGSTLALVFQPGAIDRFTVKGPGPGKGPDDGPPIQVNARIAIARKA